MPRVEDLGIHIGRLPSGPTASILDVPGVGAGHATVWRDEPDPPLGRGVARTGVTVVLPAEDVAAGLVPAGGAVLNGAGECTGYLQAAEWGVIASPIFLTSTMQVGRVYDAACELITEAVPGIGEDVVIPVVAECDDSWLNEVRRMQVERADVAAAWEQARASIGDGAPPAEGAVGAGTGMTCFGWKGGIGTASRRVPSGHTVGVLVMTNFGLAERLTVAGHPVGRQISPPPGHERRPPNEGSCIGVVVTEAPLDGTTCSRLARRVGLGLGRVGSTAGHTSGEIFLAAATGARADWQGRISGAEHMIQGRDLGPFFEAVVDASEEAVLNSLFMAETVTGRSGHVRYALPADAVREILAQ